MGLILFLLVTFGMCLLACFYNMRDALDAREDFDAWRSLVAGLSDLGMACWAAVLFALQL
jgi:hypothetical protein